MSHCGDAVGKGKAFGSVLIGCFEGSWDQMVLGPLCCGATYGRQNGGARRTGIQTEAVRRALVIKPLERGFSAYSDTSISAKAASGLSLPSSLTERTRRISKPGCSGTQSNVQVTFW